MHIGSSSSLVITAPDAPIDCLITLTPINIVQAAADLIWSPVLRKFPDLKVALSEGGIGWIPYFLERIDYQYRQHHLWTGQDFGDQLPSEVFNEHVLTCFIDDQLRRRQPRRSSNMDHVMWECDYPHSDSTWPFSPEQLGEHFARRHQRPRHRPHHPPQRHAHFSYDPFTILGGREQLHGRRAAGHGRRPRRGDQVHQGEGPWREAGEGERPRRHRPASRRLRGESPMVKQAGAGSTRPATRPRIREKPQQIADELRRLIIAGELDEGDSLGHEPDLIARFGVSRPSLREALRILEAEGLISVLRGVQGGVVVHRPDHRLTARTAALVLQTRNVSLADVFEARTIIEPAAVHLVASARGHKGSAKALRNLIAAQEEVIDDPEAFGHANAELHRELVGMAGNQTLLIVAEMLNEVVERAVTVVSQTDGDGTSVATRRRGVRSPRSASPRWSRPVTPRGRRSTGGPT